VTSAMRTLTDEGVTHPVLFSVEGRYFVKADHHPLAVVNASCFADAFEFLFFSFYVFNVNYPQDLRLVYGFVEKVLSLKPTIGKSTTVLELFQKCIVL
jgi:hypothetical protein